MWYILVPEDEILMLNIVLAILIASISFILKLTLIMVIYVKLKFRSPSPYGSGNSNGYKDYNIILVDGKPETAAELRTYNSSSAHQDTEYSHLYINHSEIITRRKSKFHIYETFNVKRSFKVSISAFLSLKQYFVRKDSIFQ